MKHTVSEATATRVSEIRNELVDALKGNWTLFEALAAISIASMAVSHARRSVGMHDA